MKNKLLESLWAEHHLPADAQNRIILTGSEPVFPSSFAVGTAAQVSIAAAAGMAAEIGRMRGLNAQTVTVDLLQAAIECTGAFTLDGNTTPSFAELSGLYECSDGWIRLHANFDHHRDVALQVLGLPVGAATPRAAAEQAARQWRKVELENAIQDNGGACAVVRTFKEWDTLPQAEAVSQLPLVEITKIADSDPRPLPGLNNKQAPLHGVHILDLTRILAGPVCGRTLAAYGADVMLINSPHLPNIESIIETSRGKRSAHLHLKEAQDKTTLHHLLRDAHVFVQGYRPGSLDALDLSPHTLAAKHPGIVYTSLSAYGRNGPWRERRGFDSLLQSASGFNIAEAMEAAKPAALPMQMLDYASGFLMAFGSQVALYRQQQSGGSWHVQVSLARTALWLRSMGQNADWLQCKAPGTTQYLQPYRSSYGRLMALPHPPVFSEYDVAWQHPSTPPGTDQPAW